MEEMKFNLNNPHIGEYKLNALKKIKEDPFFEDIIEGYSLTESEIIASASKLLKFKEDKEKCANCKGKCNKIPSKMQLDLVFDGERRTFEIEFNTCSYHKENLLKRRNFIRTDFPINYLDYDFSKELADNEYTKIRTPILASLSKRLKDETNKSIYIYGDSRLGKTFISVLFASKFIEKEKGLVSVASSSDLFKELMDLNFQDKNACKALLDEMINVDLLVLDAFGNEYKSDFIRDTFVYPILSERAFNNKLTIITSNFTLDEISSMYSLSKASGPKVRQLNNLLKDYFEKLEIKGYPYNL